MINSKTVLVLAPHADDAEIGCGGTIARLTENGSSVYVIVVAKVAERKNEILQSAKILGFAGVKLLEVPIGHLDRRRQGILDKFLVIKKQFNPDLVLQPSMTDIHQDHMVVANEGLRAFKDRNILGYETSWNNMNFDAQMFVSLKERHVQKKVRAVLCYRSQKKKYIDRDYILSLAKVRGVQIGFDYAEMFSLIRGVL